MWVKFWQKESKSMHKSVTRLLLLVIGLMLSSCSEEVSFNPASKLSLVAPIAALVPNNPVRLIQAAPLAKNQNTITFPVSSTTGNFIVVSVWLEAPSANEINLVTATDNFGNTYALATGVSYNDAGGAGYTGILYAKNITVTNSTPITITVSLPNLTVPDTGSPAITASEFSGIDPVNPLDKVAINNLGGSTPTTPLTANTGTTPATTKGYELVISTISGDNNSSSGLSFTSSGSPLLKTLSQQVANTTTGSGEIDYAIVGATGAYQSQWTVNSAFGNINGYAAAIASFRGVQTKSGLPLATHFAFTSAPQTLVTHQCSGATTLQVQDATNSLAVLNADQMVNFGGTGLQFYSDAACTNAVSSVLFPAYIKSSYTLYYLASTPGTIAFTATPASFGVVSQNQTVTLADHTWLGAAGDGLWSNDANWSNAAGHPTQVQNAIFDGTCTSCSATIDNGITVSYAHLYSSYTGTVTQASGGVVVGRAITIDAGSWNVASGSFTLDIDLKLNGGTFALGSNTLIFETGGNLVMTGGTFDGSLGTAQIGTNASIDGLMGIAVVGGTFTVNNLNLVTGSTFPLNFAGNLNVTGNLTLNSTVLSSSTTGPLFQNFYPYGGATIYVKGNVNLTSGGGGNSSATVVLNGSTAQTITGSAGSALPSLTIAQTGAGSVNLAGTIEIGGSFTRTSGTVNAGASSVQFGMGYSNLDTDLATISAPGINFNHVIFNGRSSLYRNIDALSILGNLTINDASGYTTNGAGAAGTLNLSGNLNYNSGKLGGFTQINLNFIGNGTNTVSATAGTIGTNPGSVNIVVNKGAGSLTLQTNISNSSFGNFYVTSGNLILNNHTLNAAFGLELDAGGTITCAGTCGTGPIVSCGQNGSTGLSCSSIIFNGGTITP